MSARRTTGDRVDTLVEAALMAAADQASSPMERTEMLVELAMDLQQRPQTPDHLHAALQLYDRALGLCEADDPLLRARVTARRATALQALPDGGIAALEEARAGYEAALGAFRQWGTPEEQAEAEMNLGLVLQHLAGVSRARLTDAIAAYQRALRTFDAKRFPVEFAILQNNLATAFLAIPFTDERSKMREALAVHAFEEGLAVVNLIKHPLEYAMLQNNLGNALQYASSSHVIENNLRALEAYEEALKVRTRKRTPLEYANTIANKANCLRTLQGATPAEAADDLRRAIACYKEAQDIFSAYGHKDRARIVNDALLEIEQELSARQGNTAEGAIQDGRIGAAHGV